MKKDDLQLNEIELLEPRQEGNDTYSYAIITPNEKTILTHYLENGKYDGIILNLHSFDRNYKLFVNSYTQLLKENKLDLLIFTYCKFKSKQIIDKFLSICKLIEIDRNLSIICFESLIDLLNLSVNEIVDLRKFLLEIDELKIE